MISWISRPLRRGKDIKELSLRVDSIRETAINVRDSLNEQAEASREAQRMERSRQRPHMIQAHLATDRKGIERD